MEKFVLYDQRQRPSKHLFGIVYNPLPDTIVRVLPATDRGLREAIELAVTPQAKLIKLRHDFITSSELLCYCKRKIRERNYILLFQPIAKVPFEKVLK